MTTTPDSGRTIGHTLYPQHILQFFAYGHLPSSMQAVSKPFAELAQHLADTLPGNPETTAALRKLLEAKDCAVRAAIAV